MIRFSYIISLALSLLTLNLQAAEVSLDLDQPNWQTLQYKNIPANTVSQQSTGIKIDVNASASPLIYVFDQPQDMKSIRVNGKIVGALPGLPAQVPQGEPGADDFAFRIGLVIAGNKRLNFAQRLIAADWVTTLYDLAGEKGGINYVQFLNLANPGNNNWTQRSHPDSKGLFIENIAGIAQPNQKFSLSYTLPESQSILALWISSDGDDTGARYTVELDTIRYE